MALEPRITTREIITTSLVTPAGVKNAVMIGTATWGPMDTLKIVAKESTFINEFGDDKAGTGVSGIKGAIEFLKNSNNLSFVRAEDGTAAQASVTLQNTATDVITIEGKYKGTFGNKLLVTVTTIGSNKALSVTDGSVTETFNNISAGYATNDDLIAGINLTSALIVASLEGSNGTTNLVDDIANAQLIGGLDGETGSLTTKYNSIFDDVLLLEDFNFLVIPGETSDSFHNTMASKLENRVTNEKKYAEYYTGIDLFEDGGDSTLRNTKSKRVSRFVPFVEQTHRIDGTIITLDSSYTACGAAGEACSLPFGVGLTGRQVTADGYKIDALGKRFYNSAEREKVLSAGNVPITKVGNSLSVVRGITTLGDSSSIFTDSVIVGSVDLTRSRVESFLNTVLGKPKTDTNKLIWSASIDSILQSLVTEEVLTAFNPTTVVDGVSADSIAVDISISPTFPVNFIDFTITINR